MKNVYDDAVVLDDKGEAEIELPNWFGALNKDFRYQLTAIGAPGPNLYIAEEISEAYYLHPDLYGQPEEKGISHLLFPKDKREELVRASHK